MPNKSQNTKGKGDIKPAYTVFCHGWSNELGEGYDGYQMCLCTRDRKECEEAVERLKAVMLPAAMKFTVCVDFVAPNYFRNYEKAKKNLPEAVDLTPAHIREPVRSTEFRAIERYPDDEILTEIRRRKHYDIWNPTPDIMC